jgi:hypothetical protein
MEFPVVSRRIPTDKGYYRPTGFPPPDQQLNGWVCTSSGRTYIGGPKTGNQKLAEVIARDLGGRSWIR